jgi:hypothetical protein
MSILVVFSTLIWGAIGMFLTLLLMNAWTWGTAEYLRTHKWVRGLVGLTLFIWVLLTLMVMNYRFQMAGGWTEVIHRTITPLCGV